MGLLIGLKRLGNLPVFSSDSGPLASLVRYDSAAVSLRGPFAICFDRQRKNRGLGAGAYPAPPQELSYNNNPNFITKKSIYRLIYNLLLILLITKIHSLHIINRFGDINNVNVKKGYYVSANIVEILILNNDID